MKEAYLSYYEKPSILGSWHFLFNLLFASSRIKKKSLLNRYKDYLHVLSQKNKSLLEIHLKLNKQLLDGHKSCTYYDYGEGYFYQSYNALNITGLRDTDSRLKNMHINRYIQNKDVLEIGCNVGFLTCSIAKSCHSCYALDISEHLINIAKLTAQYEKLTNVNFFQSSFEDFIAPFHFDVVLSFANHSTYDGNTIHTLDEYFNQCAALCKKNGILLFESHLPHYETAEKLQMAEKALQKYFIINEKRILNYSKPLPLDQGRTFIVATKKEKHNV